MLKSYLNIFHLGFLESFSKFVFVQSLSYEKDTTQSILLSEVYLVLIRGFLLLERLPYKS